MKKEEAIKHLEDMKKGLFLWDMDELIDLCISALNDSERAETQAYFDGQAYGWEEGRKALLADVKAEIDKAYEDVTMYGCDEQVCSFASKVNQILNNAEKEGE